MTMRTLIALVVAAFLAGCSSADPQPTASPPSSPISTPSADNEQSSVATSEVDTLPDDRTETTAKTAPPASTVPEPFVGFGQIDTAQRSEDGALVVMVTGYAWGAGSCEAIYEATISDPAEMVVEVRETVGPSPDGACEEIGYDHALTVVGAASFEGDAIVDAFDGSTIVVGASIDTIRPNWITDRPQLPNCGIDSEDGPPAATASARACFKDAYDSRSPVELEVISYGDEGETAHRFFRILDDQRLEVLDELRPPVDGDTMTGLPWIWQTHQCESFVFLKESGFDIGGRPQLNADGECAVKRTQF